MYNRYIPDDTQFERVEPARQQGQNQSGSAGHAQTRAHQGAQRQNAASPPPNAPYSALHNLLGGDSFKLASLFNGKEGLGSLLSGGSGKGLSSLLKQLKLEDIDTGDILLLLIILYLLIEGDDLELVIALGLVLIMGFADTKKKDGDA